MFFMRYHLQEQKLQIVQRKGLHGTMNYLIQRGKVRNQMINVPEGLPELLSDITREVLRCQPTTECLCQFIIDYLHSVIVTREKARVAKSVIDRALAVVDEIIADMCVCDISKDKAQEMAIHMEECFRRFLSRMRCEQRKDIEVVRFEEQDMLNAMIERCKFTEQELKISKPMIEAAYRRFVDAYMKAHEDFEGTEELYHYFKQRELGRQEEEREKMAATKIQANFRGYITRKTLGKSQGKENIEEEMDVDVDIQNQAATTIQKAYRRYLASLEYRTSGEKDGETCEPGSDIQVAVPGTAEEVPMELAGQTIEEDIPLEAIQPSQATEVESEAPPESQPQLEIETETDRISEQKNALEIEPEPTAEQKQESAVPEPEQPEPPQEASETANEENGVEESPAPIEGEVPTDG